MTKHLYECVSIGLSDVTISRIDMLCVDFAPYSDRAYASPSTKTLCMRSTLYSSADGEYRDSTLQPSRNSFDIRILNRKPASFACERDDRSLSHNY